jgi:hypothetical protein
MSNLPPKFFDRYVLVHEDEAYVYEDERTLRVAAELAGVRGPHTFFTRRLESGGYYTSSIASVPGTWYSTALYYVPSCVREVYGDFVTRPKAGR